MLAYLQICYNSDYLSHLKLEASLIAGPFILSYYILRQKVKPSLDYLFDHFSNLCARGWPIDITYKFIEHADFNGEEN